MTDLVVPFRELISVVALAQALIFAAILLAGRFRGSHANRILIFSLFIIATVKFDQLFQIMGGLGRLPSLGFIFTPIQWLLTPSLYFFVRAKVNRDFTFKRSDVLHLGPATLSLIFWTVVYFALPVEGKIAFIQSGALGEPLNALIIPLGSDLIQLGYLVAAQRLLAAYGVTLRNWFSRVDDRDIAWTRWVLAIWVLAFIGHIVLTLSLRVFEYYPLARIVLDLMNVAHLVLINALMVLGIVSQFQTPSGAAAREKYATSDQTENERRTLYERVKEQMTAHAYYLRMDLNLGELAASVAATSRELSEAINGEGGATFYDFVNRYRLEAAQRLLLEEPDEQILNIAHRSGFNSKSTFNKVFKTATGQSPSAFRKRKT